MVEYSLLSIVEDFINKNTSLPCSYPETLDLFYGNFARKIGKNRYGEKTTHYDVEPINLYDKSLSRMKLIHIVRDGRDVCLSWRKVWFGPKTVIEAAKRWRNHVTHYREWGERHPNRYCEVRYEDLLDTPDEVIQKIGDFLNIKNFKLGNTQKSKLAKLLGHELNHHAFVGHSIVTKNKNKWINQMSLTDQMLFHNFAGETLKDFDYHITFDEPNKQSSIKFLGNVSMSYIKSWMTMNFYLRRFRKYLPLILLLTQKLDFYPGELLIRNQRKYDNI